MAGWVGWIDFSVVSFAFVSGPKRSSPDGYCGGPGVMGGAKASLAVHSPYVVQKNPKRNTIMFNLQQMKSHHPPRKALPCLSLPWEAL